MGADFLLYWAPLDLTFDEAVARLELTPPEQLIETWQDHYLDPQPDDADEMRDRAKVALELIYGKLPSRELAHIAFDDRVYVFTGGMSWGDTPTDAAADVEIVNALELTIDRGARDKGGTNAIKLVLP